MPVRRTIPNQPDLVAMAHRLKDIRDAQERLEVEGKELGKQMLELMEPNHTEVTIEVAGRKFKVAPRFSSTAVIEELATIQKVWDKLDSRKAFFEVVKIGITKLKRKLGEECVNRLADRFDERRYIAITEVRQRGGGEDNT